MGHNFQHRHQATDGLLSLFTKANHDLALVHLKLEKEFQQTYPDNVSLQSYPIFVFYTSICFFNLSKFLEY